MTEEWTYRTGAYHLARTSPPVSLGEFRRAGAGRVLICRSRQAVVSKPSRRSDKYGRLAATIIPTLVAIPLVSRRPIGAQTQSWCRRPPPPSGKSLTGLGNSEVLPARTVRSPMNRQWHRIVVQIQQTTYGPGVPCAPTLRQRSKGAPIIASSMKP